MSTHDNEKNIAVSPDVLEQAMRQAEAEGKTVDELAQEAIKRHLAQKSLDRLKREAEARRGNKTDEEVEKLQRALVRKVVFVSESHLNRQITTSRAVAMLTNAICRVRMAWNPAPIARMATMNQR